MREMNIATVSINSKYAKGISGFKTDILELDNYENIINFVKKMHEGDYRKTGEAFYYHPLRIYQNLVKIGINDKKLLIAALLHDILEDTRITHDELIKLFGFEIVYIVDGLSAIDRQKNKLSKQVYFNKFEEYGNNDWRVFFIKLFDCIDNLETLHGLSLDKQQRYIYEKKQVYCPLFSKYTNSIPILYRSIYVNSLMKMELFL